MLQSDTCEICGKQALYICSECKWSAYCSRQHQLQHWKVHRDHCTILSSYQQRKQENEINKQRSELRKKYFESFSHKIFDNCSSLAEEMVQLEKKLIKNSREIFNQMEYGISMCLLARSFLNVRNEPRAAITINSYLEQKLHFLKDMRDIINFESTMAKQPSNKDKNSVKTPKNMDSALSNSSIFQNNTIQDNLTNPISVLRQFSIKKVSLIASVANIVYAVKQPVIPIYQIYTEHIEKMFGQNSLQTSNCYFMIGSHYKENNQYYKSIACFMRAAQMRGSMAGDCYYNLGILFHLLKKPKIALMMFENAAKLRENQFSENSSEVADVYHNIALIHRSMGNFKGAIQNLQKIALIYSKDKNSPEYKNAKSSIKQLQAAFRSHMQKTNQIALTTALMKDLKKTIRKVSKGQQDGLSENSFRSDKDMHEKQRLSGDNNYLRLTDQLVNKLNPLQSFHLSQLQIQLGKCQTMFMAANTLGTSHFLKIIKLSKLEELIKENQLIFKNVSIQMLSKRGIKDINMILS